MKTHNCNAQHHQDHTGDTVQGPGGRLVGEQCSDPRPDQGKYNAQDPYRPVGHTTDGKWDAAPVNAVNAMMKTLVPTAVFSS